MINDDIRKKAFPDINLTQSEKSNHPILKKKCLSNV